MIVVYDKLTGAIKHTFDYEYSADGLELQEDEAALVTLVEHENAIGTLRVDLESKTLIAQSAVRFGVDKREITAGESIQLTLQHEGEQFGETFLLSVGEQLLEVPYSLASIQITFDLPGEYSIYVPDGRIFSMLVTVRVKEDVV